MCIADHNVHVGHMRNDIPISQMCIALISTVFPFVMQPSIGQVKVTWFDKRMFNANQGGVPPA